MDGQLKSGTMMASECGNIYKVIKMLGSGGQGEVYDVTCNSMPWLTFIMTRNPMA